MVRFQRCIQQAVPLVLAIALHQSCHAQHFLADDPINRYPEVAATRSPKVESVDALYDFAMRSVQTKPSASHPAGAINTLGEVPDSSWYTNRGSLSTRSLDDLRRGPRVHGEPQPPFTVIAAKTEGVTPGFRMRDGRGLLYFVKVDPQSNPEMATAADVVGSLFLYALGYNVPENYLWTGRPDAFHLAKNATASSLSGKNHTLSQVELRHILDRVPRTADGEVRVLASLALPGRTIGPFSYDGVRSDDPNDLVPHQDRRDLRALAVIFAWLNHTDAKGDNSLDVVEGKASEARVVHHLLDFGDSFGSDSDIAKDPRHGQEYAIPTARQQWSRAYTLGLRPAAWERVSYPRHLPAVGDFTSTAFDPLSWKPNYPNPAFLAMTPEDGYWGAKKVSQFSDQQIEAIVSEGHFSNPRAGTYIARVLEQRRDLIRSAWFSQVLPLENFQIRGDRLQFKNLVSVESATPPQAFRYDWFEWDNASAQRRPAPQADSSQVPGQLLTLAEGAYMGCQITSLSAHDPRSVTIYFRRENDNWNLVGVTRRPMHP